jgi:uncharacterized membrane protein
MITVWSTILAVALANAAIKAAGPILLGNRDLPPKAKAVTALLASALLAALVVTETLGGEGRFALDARLVGLTVAALVLLLRAPVLVVVASAVVATAVTRACFG